MKIKGIIFDKDGTLIDFDSFWVSVSREAVMRVLKRIGADESLAEEILENFGVKNGVTDVNGVLCCGTYQQMGDIVFQVLTSHGYAQGREEIVKLTVLEYVACAPLGIVRPTCDKLSDTVKALKDMGLRLAVVTTDTREITELCLSSLGIKELFDDIFCDDGIHPNKPNPYYAIEFGKKYSIPTEYMAMVGDTLTDMRFAKNSGMYAFGVGKSSEHRQKLSALADKTVSSVAEILCEVESL